METDVTSCLLEEKASSHDPVAFCPSHSFSVFVTESLRTVHDYVHPKSVFLSVVFFFNCFSSSPLWLLSAARRRRWIFVFVTRPFSLSSSLFFFSLNLRWKVFVGRSSSEGLRRKVFVGSFRCGSHLVKATFLFIVDHSIVILVLQIKLVVMITYLLNSMLLGFSVLFTDPVYDDDHIFKADVLPSAK